MTGYVVTLPREELARWARVVGPEQDDTDDELHDPDSHRARTQRQRTPAGR